MRHGEERAGKEKKKAKGEGWEKGERHLKMLVHSVLNRDEAGNTTWSTTRVLGMY